MNELKLTSVRRDFLDFQFGPLSCTFMPGALHGLLGPNGAGKTTLLNLIALQLKPSSGHMTRDSQPIVWGDSRWKQTMAYVREIPAFYDELSVAETFRFARAVHERWDASLASRLADRFGLDRMRNVRTLSKGTKVKLGLVLALAQGAELVLLDEPTAGVDPTSREELHQVIRDLREQRPELCIVLSSHIFEDLNELADEFLILRNGQLAFAASRADLTAMALCRVPEQSDIPFSSDIRLTWVSRGERWIVLPRDAGLVASLRSRAGFVEENPQGMVAAVYRATAHVPIAVDA